MKTDLQQALDSNIPNEVVKKRPQGGVSLSYLETWYVIDRLNQILGQGNWGTQINSLTKVFEGEIDQSSGKAFSTSYVATISLTANIDGKVVTFNEVGYGDGTDRRSAGKAHELAVKESVSDALKRAAKNLGRSMGLALYDKTQEFVGGADNQVSRDVATSTPVPNQQTMGQTLQSGAVSRNTQSGNATTGASESVLQQSTANGSSKSRPIKELVTSVFSALQAQGKITGEEFKAKYQGGIGISKLSQAKLTEIYAQVQKDFGI